MDRAEIEQIVDRVIERLGQPQEKCVACPTPESEPKESQKVLESGAGIFETLEQAISAAKKSFCELQDLPLEDRNKCISSVRRHLAFVNPSLARQTVEETGIGRASDKIKKNSLVINKTPGTEDLIPTVCTGDDGLMLTELAPYGVIGAITPVTNATETIINNGIGMLAAGNSVIFNPHPSAACVCNATVSVMNEAILEAGGPANVFTSVTKPSVETGQELMKHPDIRLLVVTGGQGVVRLAMRSGKRVIAAGPGNPPVVVDESADIPRAAKDIVDGASLDNNIVCVVEKEIIAVEAIARELKKAILNEPAIEIKGHTLRRLEKILLDENGYPVKHFIGKNVSVILKEIDVSVDDDVRLAIVETGADHPFVLTEMMMPIIPFVTVSDVDAAIELARKVEGGCFHTAVMHSKIIDNLHKMAVKSNTTIFVKNAPAYAGLGLGGQGYTSFTIASPTGEGLTSAKDFVRKRRCTLKDYFRIV